MFLAKFLTTFGIICIVIALILLWQRNDPNRIAFSSLPQDITVSSTKKINPPVRLAIKNVDINLPIFPAKIYKQKWDTTANGVSWLDISPPPGDRGNSILYGHNWSNLLGNLIFVKPGQEIEMIYKDGSRKNFTIQFTTKVTPNIASVLRQTNDKRITIYTCTGLFDEKRFIAVATLKGN